MIFLNITLKEFLEKYPSFRDDYPMVCSCGKKAYDLKVYATKRNIGLIHENCSCGIPVQVVSISRTHEAESEILSVLTV